MGTEKNNGTTRLQSHKDRGAEYATLTDINTGDELFIALFLLPDCIVSEQALHYENLAMR